MPWARVDDTLFAHPKVARLGPDRMACMGLWVLALSWSNRHLTDGVITCDVLTMLGGKARQADRLVEVGLWDATDGGYRFHDFLHYSKSKERVEEERSSARVRMNTARSSREHQASFAGSSPNPVPVPDSRSSNREPRDRGGVGGMLHPSIVARLEREPA